eukprot:TRINITY_DN5292_c0_g1_i1.p1 TRINITY_DN5292_c0_g1~~TRINITY_DN5292_c0_g1_i1.p1  ORF type:complete len:1323 (-),score=291.62 TRINITY_DN5292_c0_g1_i1:199-4167(-)
MSTENESADLSESLLPPPPPPPPLPTRPTNSPTEEERTDASNQNTSDHACLTANYGESSKPLPIATKTTQQSGGGAKENTGDGRDARTPSQGGSFGPFANLAAFASPIITTATTATLPKARKEPKMGKIPKEHIKPLGICAMAKKVLAKPMIEILNRLRSYQQFDILIFDEKMIMERPVEEWPVCGAFLCFYSTGFPLSKAEAYVALRQPYQINDVTMQRVLLDRRLVYKTLQDYAIPVPPHVVMNRNTPTVTEDNVKELSKESASDQSVYADQQPQDGWSTFEEHEDCVIVDGRRVDKPFVEKPVSGENHNIYIYYPKSAGGGSKRLFRKVENRSSQFYPEISTVRRDSSYIYEEFLSTEGTDIKVYSVDKEYSHAEARKSPVVDGRVQRDAEGKEVRYPIVLTNYEKEIARKVSIAFRQTICGFDLLRDEGKSYVCDVNGLSFVKNSVKYYDDSARIIRKLLVRRFYRGKPDLRHYLLSGASCENTLPSPYPMIGHPAAPTNTSMPFSSPPSSPSSSQGTLPRVIKKNPEFLRCVIAVIRHGDRTPKQKLKMKVTDSRFLSLFEQFAKSKDAKGRAKVRELKLKSAVELQALLNTATNIFQELADKRRKSDPTSTSESFAADDPKPTAAIGADTPSGEKASVERSKSEIEEDEYYEKILQVKQVLERKSHKLKGDGKYTTQFSGINRKAQLKPTKTRKVIVYDESIPEGQEPVILEQYEVVEQALLVMKWGGELTHAGQKQAESLGNAFRQSLYSDAFHGLVRLHSSNRHDLKIYASDEGRVQMTAAAFSRGFLDLEGELTPILVSIVRKDQSANELLDVTGDTDTKIADTKMRLHNIMSSDNVLEEPLVKSLLATTAKNYGPIRALKDLGNPRRALMRLYDSIKSITSQLRELVQQSENAASTGNSPPFALCEQETIQLMYARWQKLEVDFFCSRKNEYNISKVPDIFDCIKYDALHNYKLGLKNVRELYNQAKMLNDIVVPQEYGMTAQEKVEIGSLMCQLLLDKIQADLIACLNDPLSTSEVSGKTYLEKLVNVLKQAPPAEQEGNTTFVRTRLYFTSESHLHSLLNVLRHTSDVYENAPPIISARCAERVRDQTEIDYLTQIVFRLYENPSKSLDDPTRFRLEISMSPGANQSPWEVERRSISKQTIVASQHASQNPPHSPAAPANQPAANPTPEIVESSATSASIAIPAKPDKKTIAKSPSTPTSNSPLTPGTMHTDRHRHRHHGQHSHGPLRTRDQSDRNEAESPGSQGVHRRSGSFENRSSESGPAKPRAPSPQENHAAQLSRRSYLNANIPLERFLEGLNYVTTKPKTVAQA